MPSPHTGKPRISLMFKAILPVAFVLLNGLMFFLVAGSERNSVLAVASGGAVMICVVVLVVIAYVVQRPMAQLEEAIGRVGEGDLSARVDFARQNDELGDLGKDFNAMVEQLRQSREEIERLHRTQMSRAEHLATLGELAAGLAHEIRNPLAGISGVIEIVSRDLPAGSPARAVIQDVKEEITQINRILTDLLETARPRPPKVLLSDLNTTAEHSVMLARQQTLTKPIQIELEKSPAPLEVEHDSDQIHQVLLNLLLNAIQAIHGKGSVRVAVSSAKGMAFVSVADTGHGIPAEDLPNIFRPFFTTKGDGTGLGLSLARRIVEDHDGRIEVTSAVEKGTCVTVLLPLRRKPTAIET
jgi:signal transduction histidine kinase